jgi:phosphoglycerol transferase MdoB-like AlkP superfamily enzyme
VNKSLNYCRTFFGALLCKFIALFFVLSLARLLFFAYNYDFFADVPIAGVLRAFAIGLRVDMCLVAAVCAPTIAIYFLPIRRIGGAVTLANLLYFLGTAWAIIPNVFDAKYFPFTLRRLGGEIFDQWELFTEGGGVYWYAALLYWHLVLFALLLLYIAWLASFRIVPSADAGAGKFGLRNYLIFAVAVACTVIGVRGGIDGKPFNTTDLQSFLGCGKEHFIANNSSLNIIQTRRRRMRARFHFFADRDELHEIFNPIRGANNFGSLHGKFAGKNIVLIILESFTAQNIGFLDREYKDYAERAFTPFLDELLEKSLCFDGFANGTISVDGLTAIVESIPALSEASFIVSPFAANRINAPSRALRQLGYDSLFFYGGKKNSCHFDTIRTHAGIERYFCKYDFFDHYPKLISAGVDGVWGVHDEEFLQFVAEILGEVRRPFFAVVYTLSSHYPFTFPQKHSGHFPAGESPLQEVMGYTDFALKQFFEAVRKTDWYKDSLFILVADHTAQAIERYYQRSLGGYSIPLAIFIPDGEFCGRNDLVAQQIDIMPTILDLVGYDGQYFSFGHSLFDESAPRFAVSYKNGMYQLITGKYVLNFDGETTRSFHLRSDFLLENDLVQSPKYKEDMKNLETFLKAFLQEYCDSLRLNRMAVP